MTLIKAIPYLAALLFLYGVYEFGAHVEHQTMQIEIDKFRAEIQERTRLASEQARKVEAERAKRIADVAEAQSHREIQTEVVTKTVTKEVIKYVQSPAVVHVVLPVDWVRIHDLAARGTGLPKAPNTTGKPDGAIATVTDADALSVVTDNYATCRQYADRVLALQDYVTAITQ